MKLTVEQVRAFLGNRKIEFTEDEMEKVSALLDKHADETMAYLVDSDDMHQLLAAAYIVDRKPTDAEAARHITHGIRHLFKRSKTITFGNLIMITELMTALKKADEDAEAENKDDAEAKNTDDEQAKETNL